VEVVLAESRDGMGIPESDYVPLLNDRTAILAVGHVFFTTGWVQDLKVLSDMAHSAGAYLIVDAYQSAGILPLQVHDLEVDILLGGGLKWLLGGPGIAFMYVRESLHEMLDPRSTGWFAVADQFEFNTGNRTLRSDARRFEGGTPAPAAVYAARAGLDLVLEKGIGLLGSRTLELVHYLAMRAGELDIDVILPQDPHRRSGIVILPDEDPHSTVSGLMEEGIIVDARPTGVRVSPYAYNNEEDIDTFLDVLNRTRSSG
jgi:kynureninase